MPLPKARLRLMRNVIEMYTNTLLYDETTDSPHLDKYATSLREIKQRYAIHNAQVVAHQEETKQLQPAIRMKYEYSYTVTNGAGQLILYYRFTLTAQQKPQQIDVENHIDTLFYNGKIYLQGDKPFKREVKEIIEA